LGLTLIACYLLFRLPFDRFGAHFLGGIAVAARTVVARQLLLEDERGMARAYLGCPINGADPPGPRFVLCDSEGKGRVVIQVLGNTEEAAVSIQVLGGPKGEFVVQDANENVRVKLGLTDKGPLLALQDPEEPAGTLLQAGQLGLTCGTSLDAVSGIISARPEGGGILHFHRMSAGSLETSVSLEVEHDRAALSLENHQSKTGVDLAASAVDSTARVGSGLGKENASISGSTLEFTDEEGKVIWRAP
jgi:hypothetical protein